MGFIVAECLPRSRSTGPRGIGVVQFGKGEFLFKLLRKAFNRSTVSGSKGSAVTSRLRKPPTEFLFVAIVRHAISPARRTVYGGRDVLFNARLGFVLEHCDLASRAPEFDVMTIDELLCNLQRLFVGIGLDDFKAFEMSIISYDIGAIIRHRSLRGRQAALYLPRPTEYSSAARVAGLWRSRSTSLAPGEAAFHHAGSQPRRGANRRTAGTAPRDVAEITHVTKIDDLVVKFRSPKKDRSFF